MRASCGTQASPPPVSLGTGASGFLEQEEDVGVPRAGQAPPTLTTPGSHPQHSSSVHRIHVLRYNHCITPLS